MLPLIGITVDEGLTQSAPGRPSLPRYELKQAYSDAVLRAGGVPVLLPYAPDEACIARYTALLDGLVVTGGAFDIGPEEYGEAAREGLGEIKPARTRFERRILESALDAGLPVLGVCGGMQLLNVVLGGSLIQHIPAEVENALPHEQAHDPREPAHAVDVVGGSLLATLCGEASVEVNTTHHQAVAKPGRGLRVSGRAPDGVVEAIEHESARFVLGVQWHPELLSSRHGTALYEGLVAAAKVRK